MSRQEILVLGAGGLVGRRIAALLAASDWAEPVAASRSIGRYGLDSTIRQLQLDATDLSGLRRASERASAIINCVAGTPAAILQSNEALLRIAAQSPQLRIVYLGSMAAYGSAEGRIEESSPLLGDLGEYSAAKAHCDRSMAEASNAVRLRPGIIYGPHSPWWSEKIGRLLQQRRLGDLGTQGQGICNLVHVDDVAAAAIQAARVPAAGGQAFNIANPSPPTWNGYFRLYAQALGVAPVPVITRTRLFAELNLIGPALKLADKVLGRANPMHEHEAIRPWLTQLCAHRLELVSTRAQEVLGVRFKSLADGLQETAAWLKALP